MRSDENARPRIGVTRWEDVAGEVIDRYWSRVREAGGEVIDLDGSAAPAIAALVADLDGLMVTGGIDVDPARYGAERHPKVRETAPARDEMECEALRVALARDIPVLAICRGHQVLNVALGGSLLQHIDSGEHRADYRSEGYPSRWHDLRRIEPDSRLAAVFGPEPMRVNSRHHQAVRLADLASGLRPTAFADGHGIDLVEGMESERHRWVVGVQWHPERPEPQEPAFHPRMRPLFEAFVREASPVRPTR
ncbi:MAG TPA: gamma-glutamyl-gamma-aminobutyrate hydrolase family protein [Dehalococcoidia bacterium]|nr:gamma-glutamyl-gamma-aminobutyrate hydrolase family protein [Dehalococcoidia bacterium]